MDVVERECGKKKFRISTTECDEIRRPTNFRNEHKTPCKIQSPFYCFEMLKTSHNISEHQ